MDIPREGYARYRLNAAYSHIHVSHLPSPFALIYGEADLWFSDRSCHLWHPTTESRILITTRRNILSRETGASVVGAYSGFLTAQRVLFSILASPTLESFFSQLCENLECLLVMLV